MGKKPRFVLCVRRSCMILCVSSVYTSWVHGLFTCYILFNFFDFTLSNRLEDDKETWNFLKIMFEEEGTARTKLLSHLGFSIPDESTDITYDDLGKQLENTLGRDNNLLVEGEAIDNGEEFFNNPQIVEDSLANEDSSVPNGKEVQGEPEEPMGTHGASFDDTIQRALVVGDYKGAVLQCITANRMADALVIAHAGGPSLWESTRDQYLRNSLTPYLKVFVFYVSIFCMCHKGICALLFDLV